MNDAQTQLGTVVATHDGLTYTVIQRLNGAYLGDRYVVYCIAVPYTDEFTFGDTPVIIAAYQDY